MRTWMKHAGWILLIGLVGCGGGGDGNDPDVADNLTLTDIFEPDIVAGEYSIALPEFQLQAFNVIVETDRTLVAPGTAITVTARQGRGTPEGALTYVWGFEGGTSSSDASGVSQVVSFAEAGTHLVSVTATDQIGNTSEAGVLITVVQEGTGYLVGDVDGNGVVEAQDETTLEAALTEAQELASETIDLADVDLDGRLSQFDLELVSNAVAAGAQAPRYLWPSEGFVGAKIRLIHPALLDPDALANIVTQTGTIVPVRGKPGYATFVLPPDTAAGDVTLKLEVGGQEVDQFVFSSQGLAQASAEPGQKVVQALQLAGEALDTLPNAYAAYFETLGIPQDQRAVIQGMLQVAIESYASHSKAFIDVFQQMEAEGKAAFEQVALANGLDDALDRLEALTPITAKMGKADALTPAQAANILAVICAAKNIADISAKIAEINDIAAGYLSWFDWFPMNKVPIVGQVITFLSGLSTAIGAITDIIDIASKFVPDIGDLIITAAPTSVGVGISATLKLAVTLKILTKLCGEAAGALISSIMDAMNEKLTKRIGSCIPMVSNAFSAAKYDREKMGTVVGKIYDCISGIAGMILDALGIEGLLKNLAETVCGLLKDPKLPMDPDLITPTCGTNSGGSWTCTEQCVGAVGLKVATDICGEEKKAEGGLECIGCDATTCAAGCCDNQNCLAFANQSAAKCGAVGKACAACLPQHDCTQGQCVCTSDCTVEGATKCEGNAVLVCKDVPGANPKCLRWTFSLSCINGATCELGKCQGGCNAENCTGCCESDGTCKSGNSIEACGINGASCAYCSGGFDQCVNGVCVCQPQCAGKQCGPDQCGGECGQCPAGSTCDANGACISNCGNGVVNAGEECEKDTDCADAKVCKACKCEEPGGGLCKCGGPGVVLVPNPCDWPDATECTGWHSLAMENDLDSEGEFEDGTQLCAWGCCVSIDCP